MASKLVTSQPHIVPVQGGQELGHWLSSREVEPVPTLSVLLSLLDRIQPQGHVGSNRPRGGSFLSPTLVLTVGWLSWEEGLSSTVKV